MAGLPLLEFKRIVSTVQKGDESTAPKEMIEANLRLVISVPKYTNRGLQFRQFDSGRNIGLIERSINSNTAAVTNYSTCATWWIRQAITRSIADREL